MSEALRIASMRAACSMLHSPAPPVDLPLDVPRQQSVEHVLRFWLVLEIGSGRRSILGRLHRDETQKRRLLAADADELGEHQVDLIGVAFLVLLERHPRRRQHVAHPRLVADLAHVRDEVLAQPAHDVAALAADGHHGGGHVRLDSSRAARAARLLLFSAPHKPRSAVTRMITRRRTSRTCIYGCSYSGVRFISSAMIERISSA